VPSDLPAECWHEFAEMLSGRYDLDFRALPNDGEVEMTASEPAMRDAVRRLCEQGYDVGLDGEAAQPRVVVRPTVDQVPTGSE
jgi:hypothetical protein